MANRFQTESCTQCKQQNKNLNNHIIFSACYRFSAGLLPESRQGDWKAPAVSAILHELTGHLGDNWRLATGARPKQYTHI
jgi:hypothetical protein